jgi:hypothetical protein
MQNDQPGSTNIVDRTLAEAGPQLPPAPIIKTRPSLPHLVFGNILLAGIVVAGLTDWAPWWVLLSATFALDIVLHRRLEKRNDALKAKFTEPRLRQIQSALPDRISAGRQVEKEALTSIDLLPSIFAVAVPTIFLTFTVAVAVFIDINAALASWHWLLRWSTAAFGGFVGWISVGMVWTVANQTPVLAGDVEPRGGETPADNLLPQDRNDIQIITQIANLQSLNRRIDTYTLEGALLSALSFSSFISIVLSDRNYLSALHELTGAALARDHAFSASYLEGIGRAPSATLAFAAGHLMALIGLMLLLCATTFLGVLVARLRFNDGFRDAESLLNVAERLNEKEDEALRANSLADAHVYSSHISSMLDKAEKLESGLSMTVNYMRFSRNLGIFFFIAALVLCGFFFDTIVAAMIATIFAATVIIGYFDRFKRGILRKEIFGHGILSSLSKTVRRAAR